MLTISREYNSYGFTPQGIDIKDDLMGEVGRILCAAVINQQYKLDLLADPVSSIEKGFLGEVFHLPAMLMEGIRNINRDSLERFSAGLINMVESLSIPEMASIESF